MSQDISTQHVSPKLFGTMEEHNHHLAPNRSIWKLFRQVLSYDPDPRVAQQFHSLLSKPIDPSGLEPIDPSGLEPTLQPQKNCRSRA